MYRLRLKEGVSLVGLCPQMSFASFAIAFAYGQRGYGCIVTSGNDSTHSYASLHWDGRALDFRTRHVPDEEMEEIAAQLNADLGPDFDVVLKLSSLRGPHMHVEWQPKGRGPQRIRARKKADAGPVIDAAEPDDTPEFLAGYLGTRRPPETRCPGRPGGVTVTDEQFEALVAAMPKTPPREIKGGPCGCSAPRPSGHAEEQGG